MLDSVPELIEELNDLKFLHLYDSHIFPPHYVRYYKLLGTKFIFSVTHNSKWTQQGLIYSDVWFFWYDTEDDAYDGNNIRSFDEVFDQLPEKLQIELSFHFNIFNRSL